jgi:steroid 5-alpha reductase family enzyme
VLTSVHAFQGSTCLIDPYWTLAPPLLASYWLTHPAAVACNARQLVSTALLLVWAARLSHSYFRREQWRMGKYEDWRYQAMRRQYGRWWPALQAGLACLALRMHDHALEFLARVASRMAIGIMVR